jgi:hypothetical protein
MKRPAWTRPSPIDAESMRKNLCVAKSDIAAVTGDQSPQNPRGEVWT